MMKVFGSRSTPLARRRQRRTRQGAGAFVALALAGALSLTAAPAATAGTTGTADITCTNAASISYSPGLRTFSQSVAVSATNLYSTCISPSTGITSGSSSFNGISTASCAQVLTGGAGSRVITWNDSTTSTFQFTRTVTNVLGVVTITLDGIITSGRFSGDTALAVTTGATNPLDCLTSPGLTSIAAVGALEITTVP
ncbi:hypothetical protein [Streptomyces sp. NPDC007117]|uniref:hypothetical protein n=1 Tax=Streptomyces sp. NPDC007117 TaxID=3154314 RepID=UPI0033E22E88